MLQWPTTSPQISVDYNYKDLFLIPLQVGNFDWLLFCNMRLFILRPKLKKKPYSEHAILLAERKRKFYRTVWCLLKLLLRHDTCHFYSHSVGHMLCSSHGKSWPAGVDVYGFHTRTFAEQWEQSSNLPHRSQAPELHALPPQAEASPLLTVMSAVGPEGPLAAMSDMTSNVSGRLKIVLRILRLNTISPEG